MCNSIINMAYNKDKVISTQKERLIKVQYVAECTVYGNGQTRCATSGNVIQSYMWKPFVTIGHSL